MESTRISRREVDRGLPPPDPMAHRRAVLARLARPAGAAQRGTVAERGTVAGRGSVAESQGAPPLRVFCSGIGGTGLSGLARLVAALGHRVSGSDRARSPLADALEREGVAVTYAQVEENVAPGTDLFVATAALPPDHPELAAAVRLSVPVVKYAEALGALVAARRGIAVAGTHGKTTTTALTAFVLRACGHDPSYLVGGDPAPDLPASSALGAGEDLVLEACEFDRSFHHYVPAIAVVLNVEDDHLDCFAGGLDEIVEAFVGFGALVKEGGALVVSADWPAAMRVADAVRSARPDVAVDTFALEREARYAARSIALEDGRARFDLVVDGTYLTTVRLALPGRHNVANALAAIAAAARAGVPALDAARAAEAFRGVRRRFDVLHEGDVVVVDDYAHHPTAIRAVVAAARARYPERRVVAVFEPHQASRTRQLFGGFADALAQADRVVVSEVYACRDREEDVRAVSARGLAAAVRTLAPRTEAVAADDLEVAEAEALAALEAGDVALFLGAGPVTGVAHRVARALREADPGAATRAPPAQPAQPAQPAPPASPASGTTAAQAQGPPAGPESPRAPVTVQSSQALRRSASARLDEALAAALGPRLRLHVPLAPYCTYRAGGAARFLVEPGFQAEAIDVVRVLRRHGVPVLPLGGGSNVLFTRDVFDGAVVVTRALRGARVAGTTLRLAAGHGLQGAIRLAEQSGLSGLEPLAGIPGTIGGAVFGNTGGPPGGPCVGAFLSRVRLLLPSGEVAWRAADRLGLRYRGTDLEGSLVLAVDLELRRDDPAAIRARRLEATRRKAASQPLEARSAGCVFRNPPGGSAGRLIDGLGLKGLRIGGAVVSPVHANFVVNEGDARPGDIVRLIEEVRARVLAASGLWLETEVRLVA